MTFKLHLKEAWNFPDGVKREATTWGKTWRCKRKWQFSGIERSHQLCLLIRGVPLDGWDVPLLPVILHSASLVICVLCTVPRGTWTFGFFGSQNQSYIPELGRRIRQAGPHHAVITNSPKMSVNTASLSLHRPLAHCRLIGGGGSSHQSHPEAQADKALSPRVPTWHRGRKRECSELGTDSKLTLKQHVLLPSHSMSQTECCDHPMSKGAGKNNPTTCLEKGGEPQNSWASPTTALAPKVLCHQLFPILQAQCPYSPPSPGLDHPRLLEVLRTSYVCYFYDCLPMLPCLLRGLSLTFPGKFITSLKTPFKGILIWKADTSPHTRHVPGSVRDGNFHNTSHIVQIAEFISCPISDFIGLSPSYTAKCLSTA